LIMFFMRSRQGEACICTVPSSVCPRINNSACKEAEAEHLLRQKKGNLTRADADDIRANAQQGPAGNIA